MGGLKANQALKGPVINNGEVGGLRNGRSEGGGVKFYPYKGRGRAESVVLTQDN